LTQKQNLKDLIRRGEENTAKQGPKSALQDLHCRKRLGPGIWEEKVTARDGREDADENSKKVSKKNTVV